MVQRSTVAEVSFLQRAIGTVFIGLGGWAALSPASVLRLTIRPEFHTEHIVALVSIGAFGAQAVLAGLVAVFSVFTQRTFLVFGLALLPFFFFDAWFYWYRPIFNELILLDVAGNAVMLLLCVRGYHLLQPHALSE